MNLPDMARRMRQMGWIFVLISLIYFVASALVVCMFVALAILPASILRDDGKIQKLAQECLMIAVPGAAFWLVGTVLKVTSGKKA